MPKKPADRPASAPPSRERSRKTTSNSDTANDSASQIASQIGSKTPAPPPQESEPSYDQIAEAAYQRFLQRGGSHGDDFADWLEAERELRSKRR
jgi:hypothetical protein